MFGKSKAKLTDLKIILIKEKSGVIKLFNVGGKQVFLKKKKNIVIRDKKIFLFCTYANCKLFFESKNLEKKIILRNKPRLNYVLK